jgi:hypothetical protein
MQSRAGLTLDLSVCLINSQHGNIASRKAGKMRSQIASNIPFPIEKPLQLSLVDDFAFG